MPTAARRKAFSGADEFFSRAPIAAGWLPRRNTKINRTFAGYLATAADLEIGSKAIALRLTARGRECYVRPRAASGSSPATPAAPAHPCQGSAAPRGSFSRATL